MQDETAPRLHRTAIMHRAIRRDAGIDTQFLSESGETDAFADMADIQRQRAVFIMHAHDIHRARKSFIEHSGIANNSS